MGVGAPSLWPNTVPSCESGGVGRLCVPCASGLSESWRVVAEKVEADREVVDASLPAARLVLSLTSPAPPDRSIDLERSAPESEKVSGRDYGVTRDGFNGILDKVEISEEQR